MNTFRVYSIVTAAILLILGILGFAFTDSFNIPTWVLLLDLVLGLWGLVIIFRK